MCIFEDRTRSPGTGRDYTFPHFLRTSPGRFRRLSPWRQRTMWMVSSAKRNPNCRCHPFRNRLIPRFRLRRSVTFCSSSASRTYSIRAIGKGDGHDPAGLRYPPVDTVAAICGASVASHHTYDRPVLHLPSIWRQPGLSGQVNHQKRETTFTNVTPNRQARPPPTILRMAINPPPP